MPGVELTKLRESRDVSVSALAKATGLSRTSVTNVESGQVTPSNRTLAKVFRVLKPSGSDKAQILSLVLAKRAADEAEKVEALFSVVIESTSSTQTSLEFSPVAIEELVKLLDGLYGLGSSKETKVRMVNDSLNTLAKRLNGGLLRPILRPGAGRRGKS